MCLLGEDRIVRASEGGEEDGDDVRYRFDVWVLQQGRMEGFLPFRIY